MIEHLKTTDSVYVIMDKINEVIDAVNAIQTVEIAVDHRPINEIQKELTIQEL